MTTTERTYTLADYRRDAIQNLREVYKANGLPDAREAIGEIASRHTPSHNYTALTLAADNLADIGCREPEMGSGETSPAQAAQWAIQEYLDEALCEELEQWLADEADDVDQDEDD